MAAEKKLFLSWQHDGTMVSTAVSQGPEFDSQLGSLCGILYILHRSAWVSSGCSGFHPQSKDMQVRLMGYAKLPIRVPGYVC